MYPHDSSLLSDITPNRQPSTANSAKSKAQRSSLCKCLSADPGSGIKREEICVLCTYTHNHCKYMYIYIHTSVSITCVNVYIVKSIYLNVYIYIYDIHCIYSPSARHHEAIERTTWSSKVSPASRLCPSS